MPITLDGTNGITQAGEFNSDSTFGFKNRIINGAMVIDQRNAGASVNPTDGQYIVDRWYIQRSQASKLTAQQNAGSVTPPTGFTNYLGITSSSAYSVGTNDYFALAQAIEGFNVADLGFGTANAQTVTISFWVRSSLTGTFGASLINGAESRSYPFTYTISSANTWTQITQTIAGDTTGTWATGNTAGMKLFFGLGAGSTYAKTAGSWQAGTAYTATGAISVVGTNGATWYVTGVQLEIGNTATSFDARSYGTELQLCQRYYQKTYDVGTVPGTTYNFEYNAPATAIGTGNFGTPCCRPFLVSMRAAPTVTTYDGAGNSGRISAWAVGNNQTYSALTVSQNQLLSFDFGYNSVAGRHYTFSYVASSEL